MPEGWFFVNTKEEGVIMENNDGTVEIRQGKILVSDPEGNGRYARIKAGEGIEIYLNGERLKEEGVVFADSKLEIEKKTQELKKELSLELENNAMQAYLNIELESSYQLKVKDHPPVNLLEVEAEIINEEIPEIKKSEISILLLKNRVRYGVKEEVIKKIIERNEAGRYLIAEGKKVKKGRDAKIEAVEKEERSLTRNFNCITSFSVGEVVAEKIPAVPGEDGLNVQKEKIKAPPVKDYQLTAADGIKLIEDNMKAVALEAGRPKIEKKKDKFVVSIVPQYVINGDVDKKTGNIKYEGDLIVQGGIFDYFDVRIGNNLQVKKSIAGCKASVDGDVLVKENIVHSEITAGLFLPTELINRIKKLHEQLQLLLQAVEEILGAAKERMGFLEKNMQLGRILRLLLTDKFKELPPLVSKLAEEMEEFNLEWKAASTLKELHSEFKGYKKILRIKNTELFEELKKELREIIDSQENLNESHVYAEYIQNSEITASGNVVIMKKGCYNSIIHSGKNIINLVGKGFIKGGEYFAQKYIYLKEVGSSLSVTDFNIGKGIYIKHSEGNTRITAPNDLLFIDKPRSNIYLEVNDKGLLEQKSGVPDIKRLKELSTYQQIPVVKS
ncbi:MAG: flagellar assembly protein A [Halanaerobium sp.]